jgi:hypothetical protein
LPGWTRQSKGGGFDWINTICVNYPEFRPGWSLEHATEVGDDFSVDFDESGPDVIFQYLIDAYPNLDLYAQPAACAGPGLAPYADDPTPPIDTSGVPSTNRQAQAAAPQPARESWSPFYPERSVVHVQATSNCPSANGRDGSSRG